MTIRFGLYGNNGGHQIHRELNLHPDAKVAAVAAMDREWLMKEQQQDTEIRYYDTLEDMIADDRVEVISLCSPRREAQADEAILCMSKGKHVYAEKPCAMSEADLDRILGKMHETGCQFREMAGTGLQQPYLAMRRLIQSGGIGDVIQVFAQKSYPYHEGRPQDEAIDGGLIGQNGIHAVRFVEHVACTAIQNIFAIETKTGNPCSDGDLHMAASMMMELENGGVAVIVANYLNPLGFGSWGNEHLRIFGSKGFMESVDGGSRTRLVIGNDDLGPIDTSEPEVSHLDSFISSLLGRAVMPISLEDELHCTRMVIRAKQAAREYRLTRQRRV
ncbi:Gfo/Idh/MocA family protein [Paenibacillus sp. UNC451MF]|uniref:Gfo/Idh/MocA family protein n=1 Tax=Paenibacillus sp. UNC451MF TaxID=1449063 RepID=UPI0004921CB4|nr:Gfo/Idh/MocA family oxidoreductase [Paenibacillus sp. UNC451MF]